MKIGSVNIVDRNEWTSTAPGGDSQSVRDGLLFIHHSAFKGMNVDTRKERLATMKSIRDYHVNTNGWSDIAYSFVGFQAWDKGDEFRIFQGRGLGKIPASQIGCNTGNLSLCIVSLNDPIQDGTIKGIAKFYDALKDRNIVRDIKGHRDCGNSTECPGSNLYNKLERIRQIDKDI